MRKIALSAFKYFLKYGFSYIKRIVFSLLKFTFFKKTGIALKNKGSAEYWSEHLVPFENWQDAKASSDHFLWRNAQYPGYVDLMPVRGADNLTVMDYGCGPGNDLVGFYEFSRPSRLIGVDVSEKALGVARRRATLHGLKAEFIHLEEEENQIPIDSNTVDLVHSSGVLHHVKKLSAVMAEIRRVMKPDARLQVMVYNYQSLWLHLYTAYIHQIELGLYKEFPLLDAFRRTTDGSECPISHCYQPIEFLKLVSSFGFEGRFKGAAVSLLELEILPKRFQAIKSRLLAQEHRDFLSSLAFNEKGYPIVDGHVAGIGACYEFTKIIN